VTRDDQPTASDVGQDRDLLPAEELCPSAAPIMITVDKDSLVPKLSGRRAAAAPQRFTLAADALFDFDKSSLKPAGKEALDALMSSAGGKAVELAIVVGHTDSVGTDAYNMALSLRRADSVKAYLVSKGVAADRIRTAGRGESQPVASNETEEGRAKNRRVTVRVTPSF
ncbi:MAG: OmpA family protein, partial [Quisquiliibacterium sp.]